MQQFVVPQFIDIEDKIFGPVTTRQFLILLVSGMSIFIIYKIADFTLFITLAVIISILTVVLAFVKVNGQTFHYFLLNLLQTIRKPSLRVWTKEYSKDELNFLRKQEPPKIEKKEQVHKQFGHGHIRDLSLIVNTGGYYNSNNFS